MTHFNIDQTSDQADRIFVEIDCRLDVALIRTEAGLELRVYLRTDGEHRWLFRLVPSGRLIGGTAYGLLPTPLASDGRGRWGRQDDNLLRNYLPRRFGGTYPHPSPGGVRS